jgi:hypothetical protein
MQTSGMLQLRTRCPPGCTLPLQCHCIRSMRCAAFSTCVTKAVVNIQSSRFFRLPPRHRLAPSSYTFDSASSESGLFAARAAEVATVPSGCSANALVVQTTWSGDTRSSNTLSATTQHSYACHLRWRFTWPLQTRLTLSSSPASRSTSSSTKPPDSRIDRMASFLATMSTTPCTPPAMPCTYGFTPVHLLPRPCCGSKNTLLWCTLLVVQTRQTARCE